MAIYGTGSFITAISPNVEVLLFGWSLIEGLGACLVIPSIAALTAANYSGKERAMAYGLLGGIAGAGVAAGPLIGGFVTTVWTWRIVFAAETVVVVSDPRLRHPQDPARPIRRSGRSSTSSGQAFRRSGWGSLCSAS